jgi:hypothetical protein
MAATDITGTTDTTGVVGGLGAAAYTQDQVRTKDKSGAFLYDGERETEGTGQRLAGGSPVSTGPGNYNPPSAPSTPFDTEGVGGAGRAYRAPMSETDPALMMTGTTDTTLSGGPIVQANPSYRVSSLGPSGTNLDTTWTDRPISDGLPRPDLNQKMSGTLDTVNQQVVLRTTSNNAPTVAPAAPTVAVTAPLTVTVTFAQVTDPVNAKITGYRVECARVATTKTPGAGAKVYSVGTEWAPRATAAAPATTSVVMGTLTPSETYVFRVSALNDNGSSAYSPWSAEVVPKPFDTVNDRYELDGTHATRPASTAVVDPNPQYNPDGTTDGPNQVATIAAAATAVGGELKVDWTAPAAKTPPVPVTGYKVTLSNGAKVTLGTVLTTTFTGQAKVSTTATVTPLSNRGPGASRTSTAATPI